MGKALYTIPPFIREPAEVYHAKRRQFLTSHQLIEFARCPLHYKRKQAGLVAEVTNEYQLVGRAGHTLILEGRKQFESEYLVGGPINPKTGKCYGSETKAFREWTEAQGKPVLSDDQYAMLSCMYAAVHSHAEARQLLSAGVAEGVLRATYCEVQCQVRLDWFSDQSGISDLKTCDDLDKFEDDIGKYHYLSQMGFYRAIVHLATKQLVPVRLIAVEKREPYRCGIWRLHERDLRCATWDNENEIENLKLCRMQDRWPTGYEAERIYTRV